VDSTDLRIPLRRPFKKIQKTDNDTSLYSFAGFVPILDKVRNRFAFFLLLAIIKHEQLCLATFENDLS
jgi:hypothetical protein